MAYDFEFIANGRLATANGGGACSQTSDYKVVVCFASLDEKVCIAEKDVRAHDIGGIGLYTRQKPYDEGYDGWAVTTVFDHANPAGGGDSAIITSPPVLWVARSGEYLPATTTPACQTNIIHLVWVVKFTEGTNVDCYQVFHAMRKSDGAWTCAAGTLASLNAITSPSATTGEWKNPQLLGMRKWDPDNSRYESYGTTPTAARTTLYLTYFGRASNSGSTPNDIWLTFLGPVTAEGKPIGDDWDDTQTWYGTHKNMSSTAYADALHSSYTLTKVDRTTAPTRAGSVATFYHTADTTNSYQYHYIIVGYSRKNVPIAAGGSRTGYFCRHRKYTPSTNTVDATESDPTAISSITSLVSGKDSAILLSPEQEGYIYDGVVLFRPESGGSSGIGGQNPQKKSKVFLGHPIFSGHLIYYDTNETRALYDGDQAKSNFYGTFNNWYTQTTRRKRMYSPSNPMPNVLADYDFWPLDFPIQHASMGISKNYSASYSGAQDLTPSVFCLNTRTGTSGVCIGNNTVYLVASLRWGAGSYTSLVHDFNGQTIPPAPSSWDDYYNYPEGHHPTHGGTRYRGVTHQIFKIASNTYDINSAGLTPSDITWPMFGEWECVNPCAFRAPFFQDGRMPYTMPLGHAFIFEAYKTNGTDNAIWLATDSNDARFADNTSSTQGCTEYDDSDGVGVYVASFEHEWRRNTQPKYTFSAAFKGETRRFLVRSTVQQDVSSTNLIARPTYNVTFNYDVFNADGDLTDRWVQVAEPKVFHGISQYEATTPCYILFAVKNQIASAVRTATVSARAKIGTITVAPGVIGETHWEARYKSYASSMLISTTDGAVSYIWLKWTPPGGQTNPPTPQAIDIYLLFDQAT